MRVLNFFVLALMLSFYSFVSAEQMDMSPQHIAATTSEHEGHQHATDTGSVDEGDHCKRDGGCCCKCCKHSEESKDHAEKENGAKDGCCCKSGRGKDGDKSESCHRKSSQVEHDDVQSQLGTFDTAKQQLS